jgi:hypothetical protein
VFGFVLFLVLLTGSAFAYLNDYLRHILFMLSGKKKRKETAAHPRQPCEATACVMVLRLVNETLERWTTPDSIS